MGESLSESHIKETTGNGKDKKAQGNQVGRNKHREHKEKDRGIRTKKKTAEKRRKIERRRKRRRRKM